MLLSYDIDSRGLAMRWDEPSKDGPDYVDKHFEHLICMRPGDVHDSPVWSTYIKPLVDPFVDDGRNFRYCDEDELHRLIWEVWCDAGVDNDVTIDHEQELSSGSSAARGSRIDFRIYYDDLHKVGVEIKAAGLWSFEAVQEQLVRYAETEKVDSMLLLTADPDLAEIAWPRYLKVPLFIVLLTGRRGRL
ncbi:hypothetical protein NDR87_13840 [Nocardia sp. CDC159]|uniref:Uncharacterized protein n=1 Tax=Nocardia pulmonis TaxID=2951408 RepID=A0A9X2E9X9_9NOCA|nr:MULTISPECIES: hypothetical protein [Nocardia]MCM6774496.1 hypothetical protein [Nocardia pulmonis]MCM6787438.1 hypothetical protein [Nocardia sp. CDC159]